MQSSRATQTLLAQAAEQDNRIPCRFLIMHFCVCNIFFGSSKWFLHRQRPPPTTMLFHSVTISELIRRLFLSASWRQLVFYFYNETEEDLHSGWLLPLVCKQLFRLYQCCNHYVQAHFSADEEFTIKRYGHICMQLTYPTVCENSWVRSRKRMNINWSEGQVAIRPHWQCYQPTSKRLLLRPSMAEMD